MSNTIEQIIRRTSSLVNAVEGANASDSTLMIHIQGAHWKVIHKLAERGTTDLRYRTELTIPGSSTGLLISPSLPVNFLAPITLWEKNGSDDGWIEMQSRSNLPQNQETSDRMRYWDWRNQQLWVPECTVTTTLRVDYRGGPTDMLMPGDSIEVLGLVEPIALEAATIACIAGGDARAQGFQMEADSLLDTYSNVNAHMRQQRPVKRIRRRPGWR